MRKFGAAATGATGLHCTMALAHKRRVLWARRHKRSALQGTVLGLHAVVWPAWSSHAHPKVWIYPKRRERWRKGVSPFGELDHDRESSWSRLSSEDNRHFYAFTFVALTWFQNV